MFCCLLIWERACQNTSYSIATERHNTIIPWQIKLAQAGRAGDPEGHWTRRAIPEPQLLQHLTIVLERHQTPRTRVGHREAPSDAKQKQFEGTRKHFKQSFECQALVR